MALVTDGQALTEDGVSLSRYVIVEGVTVHWKAHGPSFYNGLGSCQVRQVNGGRVLYGELTDQGTLSFWVAPRFDRLLFAALGRMCTDPEFAKLCETIRDHWATGDWKAA